MFKILKQLPQPRSNVGKVAHVSPTPRVTSQEVDITRRTPEVACWLWLGCWSNNVANSRPSLVWCIQQQSTATTLPSKLR